MARCIGLEKDKKLLQSELEKWENNTGHLVSDYPEFMRQWSKKWAFKTGKGDHGIKPQSMVGV